MIQFPAGFAEFVICTGDVDPELCTEYIGLNPNGISKKGEVRPYPRPAAPENSWKISSPKRASYSLNDGLSEVLTAVWPKRNEIINFCTEYKAQCLFVSVVYASDEHRPVYELSQENLEKMSALRASWIMDFA